MTFNAATEMLKQLSNVNNRTEKEIEDEIMETIDIEVSPQSVNVLEELQTLREQELAKIQEWRDDWHLREKKELFEQMRIKSEETNTATINRKIREIQEEYEARRKRSEAELRKQTAKAQEATSYQLQVERLTEKIEELEIEKHELENCEFVDYEFENAEATNQDFDALKRELEEANMRLEAYKKASELPPNADEEELLIFEKLDHQLNPELSIQNYRTMLTDLIHILNRFLTRTDHYDVVEMAKIKDLIVHLESLIESEK